MSEPNEQYNDEFIEIMRENQFPLSNERTAANNNQQWHAFIGKFIRKHRVIIGGMMLFGTAIIGNTTNNNPAMQMQLESMNGMRHSSISNGQQINCGARTLQMHAQAVNGTLELISSGQFEPMLTKITNLLKADHVSRLLTQNKIDKAVEAVELLLQKHFEFVQTRIHDLLRRAVDAKQKVLAEGPEHDEWTIELILLKRSIPAYLDEAVQEVNYLLKENDEHERTIELLKRHIHENKIDEAIAGIKQLLNHDEFLKNYGDYRQVITFMCAGKSPLRAEQIALPSSDDSEEPTTQSHESSFAQLPDEQPGISFAEYVQKISPKQMEAAQQRVRQRLQPAQGRAPPEQSPMPQSPPASSSTKTLTKKQLRAQQSKQRQEEREERAQHHRERNAARSTSTNPPASPTRSSRRRRRTRRRQRRRAL